MDDESEEEGETIGGWDGRAEGCVMESRRIEGNARGEEDEEEAIGPFPMETDRPPTELPLGTPFRELLRWIGIGMGCDCREKWGCGCAGGDRCCWGREELEGKGGDASPRIFSRSILSMMMCCSATRASLPRKFPRRRRSRSASTRRWNSARACARMSTMLSLNSRWIATLCSGVVAEASAASFTAFTSSTRERLNSASTSSLSASTHGSGLWRGVD
jgi:hypothetical protein